ncbi:IS66 family insertion sequence element accessory protein TnpA [Nannocystis pusilla]|uniref:IS66 family insertion sequence element accessory protein TnpA n=1 Tax=Nannocystis pusilla TaxID=889268 RepID=UPI003BEF911D
MSTATEATWRKRVDGWIASGQTCKEYAARIRVNPHTLGWWKWRLHAARADPRDQGAGEVGFVEVTREVADSMTNETGVLELEVGRAVIRIRGHVEADMLGRVLDVLEGRR